LGVGITHLFITTARLVIKVYTIKDKWS